MKTHAFIAVALLGFGLGGWAAQGMNGEDPVSTAARRIVSTQAAHLTAAAQAMPAEKYSFRSTPQQMSFAQLVLHVARSNLFLCSRISGQPAPPGPAVTAEAPKQQLIEALEGSFAFCRQALAGVHDSQLADTVSLFRGQTGTRAQALLELTNDLADHYAQAAIYLRLNGILPPTAAGAPARPAKSGPPES